VRKSFDLVYTKPIIRYNSTSSSPLGPLLASFKKKGVQSIPP